MELKQSEVFVNSFTPSSNETEQIEVEREDRQTVLRDPLPSLPKANVEVEQEYQQIDLQEPLPTPEPKTASREEAPVERKPVIEFASAPSISSGLTFSCVLIPRFDDHYLAGDITVDLLTWMKEICISYGWHLDAITIRPGYMHWVMNVPLTANPAHFMRVVRLQISQKIFENYPRFKRKNLSNDFWAPSFSVAAGSQPHSMEEVDNFIRQTRTQQGIY
jgi:REP element-mobilizing transposase RayT